MPKKMEHTSESWDNTKGWQSYDYAQEAYHTGWQLEGVVGDVLGKYNLGLDTAGEEDIVLCDKDSIGRSIYSNAQGDETAK